MELCSDVPEVSFLLPLFYQEGATYGSLSGGSVGLVVNNAKSVCLAPFLKHQGHFIHSSAMLRPAHCY